MAVSDPLILLGTAVGILVGLSVAILLYLERTKDKRIKEARRSSGMGSENEAYNAVQSAKSISTIMKRKGRDTEDAEVVLERAEMALESNNYSRAKSLAEDAKSKLQRSAPASGMAASVGSEGDTGEDTEEDTEEGSGEHKKAYTADDLDVLETSETGGGNTEQQKEFKEQKEKIKSLPDNYLESRFEIRQAKEMLEEEGGSEEAEEILRQARECFKSEDYSEALSLSIKCKKKIDSESPDIIKGQKIGEQKEPQVPKGFEELESLGEGGQAGEVEAVTSTKETKEATEPQEMEPEVVPAADEEPPSEDGTGEGPFESEELDELEELEQLEQKNREWEKKKERESRSSEGAGGAGEIGEVEEKLICPECGNQGREGDKYCNNCGAELVSKLTCPGCGAEVKEDDKFCPKCGIELTPITYECPDCGAEIEMDAKFCPQCGVEFE